MSEIDLEYEESSLLPPVRPYRIPAFEEWLSLFWGQPVRLPPAYLEHLNEFHGGVPGKKCFRTPPGRVRVLGRFFNFLEEEDVERPKLPSWREWAAGQDIRLDYRIAEYLDNEHWAVRIDQLTLLPIAGLDTGGRDCRALNDYDLLCLDYRKAGEPAVVTWDFQQSTEDRAVTETVAKSFALFLPMLHRCTAPAAAEKVETF